MRRLQHVVRTLLAVYSVDSWLEFDQILDEDPDQYITLWDAVRKFIHHEKVMSWHDYTAMFIAQGKVSHAWGKHDFCLIDTPKGTSAVAFATYNVADYDEFDTLYRLDPIRMSTLFWLVLLQPIADQFAADERRLKPPSERGRVGR